PADKILSSIFQIDEGTLIYNLQRIRGTTIPILYSDTYMIPVIDLPNTKEFLYGSLYQYLSTQNIYFNMFEEYVSAVIAPKHIKNMLHIYDDAPQLKRKRYAYDANNKLVEYTETYYNAAHYEYRARLFYRRK
ncbi:MAG: UTRA domain-containing protein, partial [Acholeplasmataceae bacterium]|nr:UTRA domain-containing protein [Acholeplasmataceae bacterium]